MYDFQCPVTVMKFSFRFAL